MENSATQSAMSQPYLSVVAPCYNEHLVLPAFHERVSAVCSKLGQPYEIVLVNDGSRDQTWETMLDLAGRDPHLVLVNLSRNHGHQLALTAGLSVSAGERVLIIDADLQDPPELVTEMLALSDARGADVVYGQRRTRSGETRFKLLSASLFYRLIELLSDTPIPRDTGDFRLISRRALDVLQGMPERHRFIRGMVSWIGFRQEPLLYDRDPRLAGATKYPLRKMLRFATDAITSFSIRPLRLAIAASIGTALFGLALIVYSLTSWAFGSTVVGWTSLMAAMAIFSSMQFLILGIFGEYLGRLYDQSKGRPLFIIESVVHGSEGAADAGEPIPHQTKPAIQVPQADPPLDCSTLVDAR
jgi:dolichol-phosphate mannosyltransferase